MCVYKSKDASCLDASDEPIRAQWVWPAGQSLSDELNRFYK